MPTETINGQTYTWDQAARTYRYHTGASHIAHGYGTPWDALRGLIALRKLS